MKKGKLIVVSGPSGVGKDTVLDIVIKNNKKCWKSISMTTRDKRDNEVDGVDYYFISESEFLENINNDNLLEYAMVYKGCYYGTPKDKVFKMINKGYNVILVIDVIGAMHIKETFSDAIFIFIAPPSVEELRNRLINRHTDSLESIEERIKKATFEISQKDKDRKSVV